jgi:hypothetical protein
MYNRKQTARGGAATKNSIKSVEVDITEYVIEMVFEAVAILCDNFSVISVCRPPDGSIVEFLNN